MQKKTNTAHRELTKEVNHLRVEYLAVSEIKPYAKNPKKHGEKQVRQIVASINEFNFNNPLILDENNEIIAGHGRWLAARELHLASVPVIRLTHLTPQQKRLYRIADNKLTENGQWDVDLLKMEFSEMDLSDADINLDITGFAIPEIEGIIEGTPQREADPKQNAVPFIKEEEIVSAPGNIWQLGKHRIICGNSLHKAAFEALMGDKKAELIFADPPFNLSADDIGGDGAVKHKNFAFAHGEMTEEEFTNFLKQSFTLLRDFSKEGALHYLCMDWRHISEITNAGKEVYTELKNICVWAKTNAGMGSFYRSRHELVFVYKYGKMPHVNNIALGANGRYRTNVWDYAGVNSFGEERENLRMHPTCKPVELIKDVILDASNRGGIVLDSFLGSGSTLIAAEKAKRVCCGIELEPLYIDTTIRRWETLTKQDAVLLSSGKTYRELLKEKTYVQ